ncbi:uncharacterized protein LOC132892136 [Neoarius graeffei]|uniref:uncharacterized protein LOC132892136 n=1 Tax=Neoarius graeffei TaxID=443677 RepID=UPI00298C00B8|nr:uncharacterized protein LOC132892136 [Neoarius graeffei]
MYRRLEEFSRILNLSMFSKPVFNKMQKNQLLPVIQDTWKSSRDAAIAEVKKNAVIVVGGDGRSDSPGYTAKYGSYTLMHSDGVNIHATGKIVAMNLVQVSEVKNSNHMEPEGLKRCLQDMKEKDLKMDHLATDRHIMVSSIMRKEHPGIDHQFDIWHVAKGVVKSLSNKAKTKMCSDLSPWVQSISNHLWFSCHTCNGDEKVLRERWLSILHHITDKHEWSGNEKVHKCAHPPLSTEDRKSIKWLKKPSPAFSALQAMVTDAGLLKAMKNMTHFCHTGDLEVFHSMLLKYCPKRHHFHYDAMYGRLMLAAIDWNSSERIPRLDKDGNSTVSVVYSRRRKDFVLKGNYVRKKQGRRKDFVLGLSWQHKHSSGRCKVTVEHKPHSHQSVLVSRKEMSSSIF